MRRKPPPIIPDPELPHGAEGPAAREGPEQSKKAEHRQFVKMPPVSNNTSLATGNQPQSERHSSNEASPAGSHTRFSAGGGRQYELRSASEVQFPELFSPVNTGFWAGLSEEQQLLVTRMQAAAMEKVGFESGTQKYFIDAEIDRKDLYTVQGKRPEPAETQGIGGGNWILGGILIGAGLAALALGVSPILSESAARLGHQLCLSGGGGILLGGLVAAIKK